MSIWRGAKLLTRYEWAMAGYGALFNLFLIIYFLLAMFTDFQEVKENSSFTGWTTNFLMLAIIPCLGFFMNRAKFNGWRLNHMAYWLADLRRLPISFRHIAAGKLMTVASLFLPTFLFLLLLQYLMLLDQFLTPLQMLNYSLFWLGYGVLGSCIYALFEIILNGKRYLILCIVLAAVFLSVAIALAEAQRSVIMWTLEHADSGNWLPSLISILAGIIAAAFIYRLMARLLSRRSLIE
ncbi:hypothetical protein SAMN05444162_1366 [Paenibacillaceae bacterium GAS479]|nr:hypothetical protein SAMN05444162_1366 [Paenibacillaceae bacterium GAS479]